jgi:hypothetical protein
MAGQWREIATQYVGEHSAERQSSAISILNAPFARRFPVRSNPAQPSDSMVCNPAATWSMSGI